ncbi:MAG: hypothetical protein CMJ49_07205 [Planctomycetaceae bacterium]|nr:hypothetical protein [Planctomycetaceae bacterium]
MWHEPPVMTLPEGSRIRDGQTVSVDYYHTAMIYRKQVMCCLSEPKLYEILQWQIEHVRRNLAPDGYFMMHDEMRVQGWDASCVGTGLTPGELLADSVGKCTAIIKQQDAGKPIYVWSDMFDPHHNAAATGRYYLVKGDGPWHGSWKGLDKDVIIVNWNSRPASRLNSLRHFAQLGHRQILAGYYDVPVERIDGWLEDARKVEGVMGVIYTTWQQRYDDLEAFSRRLGKR